MVGIEGVESGLRRGGMAVGEVAAQLQHLLAELPRQLEILGKCGVLDAGALRLLHVDADHVGGVAEAGVGRGAQGKLLGGAELPAEFIGHGSAVVAADVVHAVVAHTGRGVVCIAAGKVAVGMYVAEIEDIAEGMRCRGIAPAEEMVVACLHLEVGITEVDVERVGVVDYVHHVGELGQLRLDTVAVAHRIAVACAAAFARLVELALDHAGPDTADGQGGVVGREFVGAVVAPIVEMAVYKIDFGLQAHGEPCVVERFVEHCHRVDGVSVFDGARGVAVGRIESSEISCRHHSVYSHVLKTVEGIHI